MTQEQQKLTEQQAEEIRGGGKVYVVAANYADDPHPHVEGVFLNEEDAKELKKKCAAVNQAPHPVAWQVLEREVQP